MRVLQIMSSYGGGISSFIYNKATALVHENIIFDVVTYSECSDNFKQAIKATGGHIYQLQNPKKHGWSVFKQSLTTVLKANRYDAIHCHITGYRALPYYWLSRKYCRTFYLHAHTTVALLKNSWHEKLITKIEQLINQRLSTKYLGCGILANQAIYGEVPASQMVVIPNSIDLQRFLISDSEKSKQREALREQYQINHDTIVVGHIGRLHAIKNHEWTLQIARQFKKAHENICLLIIGDGNEKNTIQQQIEQEQLGDYVKLLGRVEPLEAILPMLDGVILPSLMEGLPTIVVEMQAFGLPTILSDTITKEVDFKLGLVTYLPIDQKVESWVQAIQLLPTISIPSLQERQQTIEMLNYTNEKSSQLYLAILKGEMDNFTNRSSE